VYLYRNERALPRAFVVRRVEVAEGLEGALAWLAEHDPGEAAVVEGSGRAGGKNQEAGGGGMQAARIVQWTPNRVRLEAQGPGLLVLSEIYDPDWRVWVDGHRADVLRTDGILRGVYLEQGWHQVTFVYWPAGLGAGCGVTAAGWVCVAALWAVRRKRIQ
jgi:hypothetical protein